MQFIRKNNYVLLVIVLCILFTFVGIKKMETEIAYEKVIVTEGDTLWGYSHQYAKHMPTDQWTQETMKLNNLSSNTILIGEELRLPKNKRLKQTNTLTQIAGDTK